MVLDAAVVAVVVAAAAAASSMPPRLPPNPPPTNLHGTHSIQYFKSLLVEREAEAASPPNQRLSRHAVALAAGVHRQPVQCSLTLSFLSSN